MVRENILRIRERITLACSKINQDPDRITIIAVTKGRAPEQIKEVVAEGIADIGENRTQEAILKYKHLTLNTHNLMPIKWHMVGHLQTNKVKDVVRIFDLIQSVDSLRLANEINKQASKINKIQSILIQINTSGESTKFGLKLDETPGAIREISQLKNINIKGLMTIAPIVDKPEEARLYFRKLRDLKDEINALNIKHLTLDILSMGMSDDFEVAIEEGSNMIRLGRAIFANTR